MKRFLLRTFLVLLLLAVLLAVAGHYFAAPLVSLVPGLSVEECHIRPFGLAAEARNFAYSCPSLAVTGGYVRLNLDLGSPGALRKGDISDSRLFLDLRDTEVTLLETASKEKEQAGRKPFLIPKVLRRPAELDLTLSNIALRLPQYGLQAGLQARVTNSGDLLECKAGATVREGDSAPRPVLDLTTVLAGSNLVVGLNLDLDEAAFRLARGLGLPVAGSAFRCELDSLFKVNRRFLERRGDPLKALESGELTLALRSGALSLPENHLALSNLNLKAGAVVTSLRDLLDRRPEAGTLRLALAGTRIILEEGFPGRPAAEAEAAAVEDDQEIQEDQESAAAPPEEVRRNWESLVRLPFLLRASMRNVTVESGDYGLSARLDGALANAYNGLHYVLTGALQTVAAPLGAAGEDSHLKLVGGLDGNNLRLDCETDLGEAVLSVARLAERGVTVDRIDTRLQAASRLDWAFLHSAPASQLVRGLTNAFLSADVKIGSMDVMEGKIRLEKPALSVSTRTAELFRNRENYTSLGAWFIKDFRSGVDCSCERIAVTNVAPHLLDIRNARATAYTKSDGVVLSNLTLNALQGVIRGTAYSASKKVAGQDAYLPYLELDLETESLDVGLFCDLFNLQENRMDGRLSGELKTTLFGQYVKHLSGALYAGDKGTFTLGKAEEYMGGMGEGLSKDLVNVLAGRLKKYPYRKALVELSYENKVTTVSFDLEGDGDSSRIKLPVHLHANWLDLLELAKEFK